MARSARKSSNSTSGAVVGYEAELWQMADALRTSLSADRQAEPCTQNQLDGSCEAT
jgi:hypothetical protein